MVGSSAPVPAEATEQRKHPRRKREKTQEEKDAHNASCVKHRQRKKMRIEQLEKVETDHLEMLPKFNQMLEMLPKFNQMLEILPKFNQMRGENQRMKAELEEQNSKMLFMENENRELRRILENQVANKEQMRLIPTGWNFNGQHFSSFEEAVNWFTSQTYDFEQVVQGAGTNMTDFAAGSSIADALPFGLDASINHLNEDRFLLDSATGGLTNSGAGSSGANNGLAVDAAHAHNSGQFTPDDFPAAGSLLTEEYPFSKAV